MIYTKRREGFCNLGTDKMLNSGLGSKLLSFSRGMTRSYPGFENGVHGSTKVGLYRR